MMINSFVDNHRLNIKATRFLDEARNMLAPKDFFLLSELLVDWHSTSSLLDLLAKWECSRKSHVHQTDVFLHILCFNVRGLNQRWDETCLLAKSHRLDILVLGEVGHVDFALMGAAFSNYKLYYQKGENAHGGVLVMIRNGIHNARVSCTIPNVCVIDLLLEQTIRLVALYAPVCKTWKWTDLSSLATNQCVFMGDFNIDIEQDGKKANDLLERMDLCSLGPVVPDSNTSLLSERTIDYALKIG
jgi:hypothetical protein